MSKDNLGSFHDAVSDSAPEQVRPRPIECVYDVFVIYAESDSDFVTGYLVPNLGVKRERILLSSDLTPGAPLVGELERAITRSALALAVLSPAYLSDRWAGFTDQLAGYAVGLAPRLIPIWLAGSTMPLSLGFRVALDFRERAGWDEQMERLRRALGRPPLPAPAPVVQPAPPRRRRRIRLAWVWGGLAAASLAGVVLPRLLRRQPAALPAWLADDFVPAVEEAERQGKDLGVASGHYLGKQPSSAEVFKDQVSDLSFVIDAYDAACEELRANSERYRANLSSLSDRDALLKNAAASLFEFEESWFRTIDPPRFDPKSPLNEQYQALRATWRTYETASAGPLRRVADGLTRLEQEMLRASGVERPACPTGFVNMSSETRAGAEGRATLQEESQAAGYGGCSGPRRDGLVEIAAPLGCYAETLRDLAKAAEAFSNAPLNDAAELHAAAELLKAPIQRNNKTYARVHSRRVALTLRVLRMSPRPPGATAVVCALDSVERYQLDAMSPALNGLLVNVIPSWRDRATDAMVVEVREHRKDWRALCQTLLVGADAFAIGEPGPACAESAK